MVGPGARKPSVGEGIESRRPLFCSAITTLHSLFIYLFVLSFIFTFASILVCVNNNNNNNNNNKPPSPPFSPLSMDRACISVRACAVYTQPVYSELREGQLVGQMLLQRLATGATDVKQAIYRRGLLGAARHSYANAQYVQYLRSYRRSLALAVHNAWCIQCLHMNSADFN